MPNIPGFEKWLWILLIIIVIGVIATCYNNAPRPDAVAVPASSPAGTSQVTAPQPQPEKIPATAATPPSTGAPKQIVESEKRDLETARKVCGDRVVPVSAWFFMADFSVPTFWTGFYCPSRQRLTPPTTTGGFNPKPSSVLGFVSEGKLYSVRFRSETIRKRVPVWNLAGQPEEVTDWKPGQNEGQALQDYHRSH